jgi:hypothetical protein
MDIVQLRLLSHRLRHRRFEKPQDVVSWFGGMQAQDYGWTKWAIGLRCAAAKEVKVEDAFADRDIVRTWLMRGTIQVTSADDVRWILQLLAPRLMNQSARRLKQLELDEKTLLDSFDVLIGALENEGFQTRYALLAALDEAGITMTGQRGYHILRQAGLRGLVCFGPEKGKEQQFGLLDASASTGPEMTRDEALSKLAARYFRSHGLASVQDFVWWSGLTSGDARKGLELAKSQLTQTNHEGDVYWCFENDKAESHSPTTVRLLPAYDEYYLGYKNRDAILDSRFDSNAVSSGGVFRPMIVVDGQIKGIWKRKMDGDQMLITPILFESLNKQEKGALTAATEEYGQFLETEVK